MKNNLGHQRGKQRRTSTILTLMSLILLAGAGCQTVPPDDERETESMESVIPSAGLPKADIPDESPLHVRDVIPPRTEDVDDDTGTLPQTSGEEPRDAPPETTYPDKLIKNIADADEDVEVVLNFDAAPLTEIVPLFSELLNFSYLIDPSVKGAVTMTVESEMKAREAWQMFEHILWLAGAYASRNPGFIHILPFDKMAQERRLLVKHDPAANVEVAFVPVRFAASSELVNNVKPFLTNGATLTDIPWLNSLLVVESPENMPKIRALIDRLDKKGEANWPHRTIQCQYVDADMVVDEMNQLLPVLGFPVSNKTPSGGKVKLTALPRLQIVVASAAVPEVLDEVERWIDLLDKEDMAEQESLFFYNVKHSDVESLTDAVDTFFPNSATTRRQPRSTDQSTSSKATPSGDDAPSSPRRSGSADRDVEVETIFDTPVLVYADPEQNRLTIRTTQRAYAMVQALLARLDAPPLQVLIQGVLAEITLTKNTEYGFAYALQDHLGSGEFDLLQGSDISGDDSASLF
ncbi:MAG: secretin N-terminal domain-containing protein, partial [bacterium]